MSHCRLPRTSDISVCIFVTLLATVSVGNAETFPFRVAYDEGPGADEIESGDLESAIEILEALMTAGDAQDRHNALPTLCGAYVLSASLDKATEACDAAVALSPSELAYNNRGVLRVHAGDLNGARADFDRARPKHMDEYLDYLKTKDIGLIADGNFGLLEELSARKSHRNVNAPFSVSTSSIENIIN